MSKSKKIYAYEHNTVTLNCVASGMPKPELTWHFEQKLIAKNQLLVLDVNSLKYSYSAKNGSLTISDLSFDDTGTYFCTASSIDKFPSATINYTIKGN